MFQFDEWESIRLDAEDVLRVLRGVQPQNSSPLWSVDALEFYFNSYGRVPIWKSRRCPFHLFLSLFPRTFELFGHRSHFVRARHMGTGRLLDTVSEVVRNICQLSPGMMSMEFSSTYLCGQRLRKDPWQDKSAERGLRDRMKNQGIFLVKHGRAPQESFLRPAQLSNQFCKNSCFGIFLDRRFSDFLDVGKSTCKYSHA